MLFCSFQSVSPLLMLCNNPRNVSAECCPAAFSRAFRFHHKQGQASQGHPRLPVPRLGLFAMVLHLLVPKEIARYFNSATAACSGRPLAEFPTVVHPIPKQFVSPTLIRARGVAKQSAIHRLSPLCQRSDHRRTCVLCFLQKHQLRVQQETTFFWEVVSSPLHCDDILNPEPSSPGAWGLEDSGAEPVFAYSW